MGEVVELASRKPHVTGEAKCIVCKHEWIAIAPAGTFTLQCPSCELYRGYMIGHVESSPGTIVFTCKYCDTQRFELVHGRGAMCIGCGFTHSWEKVTDSHG